MPALLCLSSATSLGCVAGAVDPPASVAIAAITGGAPVADGAWPNVVLLDVGCTGVLMAPDLVVYAAHCGLDVERVFLGERFDISLDAPAPIVSLPDAGSEAATSAIAVTRCASHPDAAIGSGADLAFCVLERAVDAPLVPPAIECERELLPDPLRVTLVGYGFDRPEGGRAGIKRSVVADVTRVAREIVIGDADAGTCRGDSGGPALAPVTASEGEAPVWRVLAVMSSGAVGDCGIGFYSDLRLHLGWLESESQRDLTPCSGPEGDWTPSADCRASPLDPDGLPMSTQSAWVSTCGPAFAAKRDANPPRARVARASSSSGARVVDTVIDADDAGGWGVRRVELALLDAHGQTLATRADELPPYQFTAVEVGRPVASLRVNTVDRAGNITALVHDLDAGGCRIDPGAPGNRSLARAPWWPLMVALVWLVRRMRVSRARIDIKFGCHRCAGLDADCGGEPPPKPPEVD